MKSYGLHDILRCFVMLSLGTSQESSEHFPKPFPSFEEPQGLLILTYGSIGVLESLADLHEYRCTADKPKDIFDCYLLVIGGIF